MAKLVSSGDEKASRPGVFPAVSPHPLAQRRRPSFQDAPHDHLVAEYELPVTVRFEGQRPIRWATQIAMDYKHRCSPGYFHLRVDVHYVSLRRNIRQPEDSAMCPIR